MVLGCLFRQGEQIKLSQTGGSYSNFSVKLNSKGVWDDISNLAVKYVKRYKPINVSLTNGGNAIVIHSGYDTFGDLSLDKTLSWKIKTIINNSFAFNDDSNYKYIYFLSSNKNHFLVCNGKCVKKIYE